MSIINNIVRGSSMGAITYFKGTVSTTQGSPNVTVVTGDPALVSPYSLLLVGNPIQVARVKEVEISTGTLILFDPWETDDLIEAVAINEPSHLEAKEAAELLRQATLVTKAVREDSAITLDALREVLTSTDESIILETSEGDVEVVPWGYLRDKFEAESSGLLTEFETDLKRNKLLALAGIVL